MRELSWKEALGKSPGPHRRKDYLVLYLKAFAMGTADLIPGVSGGTVAFMTGIYENLLDALASLKRNLLVDLAYFRFKTALSRVHIRFMVTVALGMATAIFSLSRLMHYLVVSHPIHTNAAFFGLIAASALAIFGKLSDPRGLATLGLVACGIIISYYTTGLVPIHTPEGWWFIYLCGVIGVSAMILPGISGSFLLLVLGKYEFIVGAVKSPFMGANP